MMLSISYRQKLLTMISWSLLAFSIGVTASMLDLGMDVSDTAYYFISIEWYDQVYAQATLFGPLWNAISPFEGIWQNRLLNLAFLVSSSVLLGYASCLYVGNYARRESLSVALPLCGVAAFFYYYRWLPDPSYNSMNFGFLNVAIVLSLTLSAYLRQHDVTRLKVGLLVTAVTMAGFMLLLSKITTVAVIGPVLACIVIFHARRVRDGGVWLAGLLGFFCGVLIGLALLYRVGVTPTKAVSMLREGAKFGTALIEPRLDVLLAITRFLKFVSKSWAPTLHAFPLVTLFLVLSLLTLLGCWLLVRQGATWRSLFRLGGQWFFALSFVCVAIMPGVGGEARLSLLLIVLLFGGVFTVLGYEPENADEVRRKIFILLLMISALLAYCFGTNARWSSLLPSALLYFFVPFVLPQRSFPMTSAAAGLVIAAAGYWASYQSWTDMPYRMEAPMAHLTEEVHVGPRDEIFYVTKDLAPFYRELQRVRTFEFPSDRKPVLLDMTGRTPMANYQLGARIPGTPWLLSGYPGSDRIFHAFLSALPPHDLKEAWLFVTDTPKDFSHQADILKAVGLDFPGGYELVTTVPVPYIKKSAKLYRPVPDP